jgi:hypothetical protein
MKFEELFVGQKFKDLEIHEGRILKITRIVDDNANHCDENAKVYFVSDNEEEDWYRAWFFMDENRCRALNKKVRFIFR